MSKMPAVLLSVLVAFVLTACASDPVIKEVPVEVVVEKEVVKEVMVPGETVVVEREVVKEVMIPGETIVVEKEVVKEVMIPGETIVVEKEVVKEVEVEVVVEKEVVKEVMVPGETIIVEKEVVKEVMVPGETIIVEKEVVKEVMVPGETVVVKEVEIREVIKTVEVPVAAPEKEKVLRVRIERDPTSRAEGTPGGLDFPMLYIGQPLVRPGPDSTIEPGIAQRWESNEDATSWTFYISPGVKWHDLEPFTAEDVAFTFTWFLEPESPMSTEYLIIKGGADYHAGTADSLPGITVVDDLTVKFDLENSDPNFAQKMSTYGIYLLPEHVFGGMTREEFDRHPSWTTSDGVGPIGLGPFKMAKLVPNQFAELVAFDEFFLGAPNIDSLVIVNIVSPDAAQLAMKRGDIDLALWGQLSTEILESFVPDPRFNVVGSLPTNDFTYYINNHVEDLRNEKFRLAFAKAFDRQALLDGFAGGLGVTLPINFALHQDMFKPEWNNIYDFDPEESKRLLAEIGWDSNREIDVILINNRFDLWADQLAVEQQMLAEVGIKANYRSLERGAFVDLIVGDNPKDDFDMRRDFLGIYPPNPLYGVPGGGYYGWTNPALEEKFALANRLERGPDKPEYVALFQDIVSEFVEKHHIVSLYANATYFPYRTTVKLPMLVEQYDYPYTSKALRDVPLIKHQYLDTAYFFYAPERMDIEE